MEGGENKLKINNLFQFKYTIFPGKFRISFIWILLSEKGQRANFLLFQLKNVNDVKFKLFGNSDSGNNIFLVILKDFSQYRLFIIDFFK